MIIVLKKTSPKASNLRLHVGTTGHSYGCALSNPKGLLILGKPPHMVPVIPGRNRSLWRGHDSSHDSSSGVIHDFLSDLRVIQESWKMETSIVYWGNIRVIGCFGFTEHREGASS